MLTVDNHLLFMKPPFQLCMLCTVYDWRHVYIVNEHSPYLLHSFRVLMARCSSYNGANIDSCDLQTTLQLIKLYSSDLIQTNVQYNCHIPTKLHLST